MNIERASGWSRAVVEIRGDTAKLRKAEGCMRLRLVEKLQPVGALSEMQFCFE